MDSFERKDHKRALESRENWKTKAIDREQEIRKLKDRVRYLEGSRSQLKERLKDVEKERDQMLEDRKLRETDALLTSQDLKKKELF